MNLYIDCEFNSFGGHLISLALVPADRDVPSFYEVINLGDHAIHPWVAEHVMPKLEKPAVSQAAFRSWLQHYLDKFDAIHVIADWPEDIAWLCRMMITGPGQRIRYPAKFTMECRPVNTVSTNPHNALADAQSLRDHFENWVYITNPTGFDNWEQYLSETGEWVDWEEESTQDGGPPAAKPFQVRYQKA
jgi:hypothetical protein